MARTVYSYELSDSDFTWLINNYLAEHPDSYSLQVEGCPVILLSDHNVLGKEFSKEESFEDINTLTRIDEDILALLRKP